jgi:hypothetical protein
MDGAKSRDPDRMEDLAMCMDAYVQEILIREQIADGQRQAARRHLLAKPSRARRRWWVVVHRLVHALSMSGIRRRVDSQL